MGLLPKDLVNGDHKRQVEETHRPLPAPEAPPVQANYEYSASNFTPISSVSMMMFQQALVYRVARDSGIELIDANTHQTIRITEAIARKVATMDYTGTGEISKTSYLQQANLEMRVHQAPAWRVDFDDSESTSLYISASDGSVLERRNTYWRIFDVFWMLHIMDYQERSDFNNTLIIITSLILLWMGLSGILLWGDSFQREDFALVAKWHARSKRCTMDIRDSEGGPHKTLLVRPLKTLFESMAAENLALPSSCGGGGTCGLCRVRISPAVKISVADRRAIPQSELEQGYRLACQHRINCDASVTLPHGLLDAKNYEGSVVSSRFVTPFICEIRIHLDCAKPMSFRAGSYVQMRIPPFQSSMELLDVPEEVKHFWIESQAPTTFGTDTELYRTYSISSAPGELQGEIALNVRMAMPSPDKLGVPIGIGSAYLASLKVGSPLSFKGPLGDFSVHENAPELIFIGGGAGMGPLRSMILDQLTNKKCTRSLSFWYGARSVQDLYYTDLFTDLSERYEHFSWHVALSDNKDTSSGIPLGYIHELVREELLLNHPNLSRCSFHVCGPPLMLKAVLQTLADFNISSEKIAFDDFGI